MRRAPPYWGPGRNALNTIQSAGPRHLLETVQEAQSRGVRLYSQKVLEAGNPVCTFEAAATGLKSLGGVRTTWSMRVRWENRHGT